MEAAEEDTQANEVPQEPFACTPEEFERWWEKSQELFSVLRRLPRRLLSKTGMQSRQEQLLDRWEDLKAPTVLDDEIDVHMVGALRHWIHDSEILIRYIISSQEEASLADEMPAANLTVAPRLAAVESMEKVPAVTPAWHWPWIEGWDNEKRRKRILGTREKKDISLKKKLMIAAFGVGAVYVGAKYLDEED